MRKKQGHFWPCFFLNYNFYEFLKNWIVYTKYINVGSGGGI